MTSFRFLSSVRTVLLFSPIFLLYPLSLHADAGDWVVSGVHWEKGYVFQEEDDLFAGIDKDGSLYIKSDYGIFKYDDAKGTWVQELADFDQGKLERPSTSIKRTRGELWGLCRIEVSDSIVYECRQNWFSDNLRFKKMNHMSGRESTIAIDVSKLPGLKELHRPKYLNRMLDFDGRRIWFTLCSQDAMGEGDVIIELLAYLDTANDTLGHIPKEKFPTCDSHSRYPQISKVVSDSEYIWIGTCLYTERGMMDDVGLFRLDFDLRSMLRYSRENNILPSNGIVGLLKLKNILWVATTKGLAKHDLKTEEWEYYNISEQIVLSEDVEIEYLPCGNVVAESAEMGARLRFLGTTHGVCEGFIVELKKKQEGWVKANGYAEKPREVLASLVYLSPDENAKKVAPKNYGWHGHYCYPVVGERIEGWYRVLIDKGIIPRASAQFTVIKTDLQE